MPVYIQAYVTCAAGVHYVGFMLMTSAITSGIVGYISGHLHQHIGRIPLILTGQVPINDGRISADIRVSLI